MADEDRSTFGPNEWLVEEMYDQFKDDPNSVSESWREFFTDYRKDPKPAPANGATSPSPAPAAQATPVPAPAAPAPQAAPTQVAPSQPGPASAAAVQPKAAQETEQGVALRGAAARIVANMEASLGVPTATSVRQVPAKLLEVNRKILNNHLGRTRGGKVSFTHIIGYAIVRALEKMPVMNSSFVDGDPPRVVHHKEVGVGLAVDLVKSDGSHTLLVPCIKKANELDFQGFWQSYEDLIRKVRTNKIGVDDFSGVTVSLTNPGTIGTVSSVPRLMPGQGVIVGVGAIDYPAEYQAADPQALARLGVSKVISITSTYDHRIIQGAESGEFLQWVHKFLLGEEGFYDDVFRAMGVPYEPVRWRRDINPLDEDRAQLAKQVQVHTLINMYRVRGHLIADLDPLAAKDPHMHAELDPATYGLTIWDLDREFYADGLAGKEAMTLGDMLGVLRDAYCRTVGVEYMHIQEPDQKRWIQEHVEGVSTELSAQEQRWILSRLNAAEAFEKFLHTKYVGQKRFGLEGGESAIPLLETVIDEAAVAGVAEVVLGMAHRGRLNVLTNVLGKNYRELFKEFEGDLDPDTVQGSGDVKYHKGATGSFAGPSNIPIPLTLASNPSHLEAVDPVVEGMTRAKQDLYTPPPGTSARTSVLSLLIHGDAAFAGQGVVAETLNLSMLPGYRTGGTVHLVINNQVGFTTSPESARSSVYATDVAKMVQAPIFHVNGDDPEACVRVAKLAFAFRQEFEKDVVIDMVCYRRFGHNEGDEPSYTQPQMYERIEQKRSVRKLYTEALVKRGDITMEEAESALDDFSARLQAALDETRQSSPPKPTSLPAPPPTVVEPSPLTGVSREILDKVANAVHQFPSNFTVHPKLTRQLEARAKLYADGQVDWALGEALAFGSLLAEGTDVRVAGQDTRRGTFSHRHAVLVDYHTGVEYVPLWELGPNQGRFFIYDSLLSEYAALGFEYGYSVVQKNALVAWEAQFGDFMNGAQIIIDQFIVAAEDKWGQTSGLVLMLPHGYEGQGPEHSSARLERFLALAAEDNMSVASPTSAAQYFHLLRRQVHRERKTPLVIMSPKWLLRRKEAYSPVDAFVDGRFLEVIDDPTISDPDSVQRVVFASGKVAVQAAEERTARGTPIAIVRIEQLYPWPEEQIAAVLDKYAHARDVVWLQEEPRNMGAWSYLRGKLARVVGDEFPILEVTRVESGSPASGSAAAHALEQADLFERALTL